MLSFLTGGVEVEDLKALVVKELGRTGIWVAISFVAGVCLANFWR